MLSYGSFVWMRQVFGEAWWIQRIGNLAIHVAVVLALWGFYREVLRHLAAPQDESASPGATLGVALGFFALNPVAVYAVAYLIQRSILMATLFTVLGLWAFAAAIARGKPLLFGAAIACYALAIMSKEYAVTAPLAAIPVYILVARPSAKRLAVLAAFGAILMGVAAYVLLRRYGEIIGKPFDEFSHVYLAQLTTLQPGADTNAYRLSILNQAYLFFHYGLRWFLPAAEWMSINLRPPFPLTWTSLPHVLGLPAYLATIAGGSYVLLRFRDRRALAALCVLLPALLFATEFATVWVQDPFVLYRSYLWAIGVPGIVFVLLEGMSVRALAVTAVLAGTLLVWQSIDRVLSLATPERAWSDAIAKLPADPRSVGRWFPYLNRGAARVDNRQYNLAMQDFEVSSNLGDMGAGVFNRGALYAANGEHLNALTSFEVAERQGYALYNLPFQRGLSLLALGRVQDGYVQLVKALAMNPPTPTRELVLLHLGRTAMQLRRPVEAVNSLQQLVAAEPGNPEGVYYLAMAHVMNGDYARAREAVQALGRIETSVRLHYVSALTNYGLKLKPEAQADIRAAINRGGETPHLREWRDKIEAMPGPGAGVTPPAKLR
jgi:protein O-mannosyl-transferase